jgi:hypothetical protein
MAGFWELILVFNEITSLWWAKNFRFEKKECEAGQKHLNHINYLTLNSKVKMRSRWNTTHRFMIIHGTPTYQISLIYCKRQKGYANHNTTTYCVYLLTPPHFKLKGRSLTCLSLQIGQWYLVCRCIITRECVMYQHDHIVFHLWP